MKATNDRSLTSGNRTARPVLDVFTRYIAVFAFSVLGVGTVSAGQSLESIQALAEAHALNVAAADHQGEISVRAGRLDSRLTLATCDEPLTSFDQRQGLVGRHLSVGIRCSGEQPWTIYVPVTITAIAHMVTVREPLPRGTVLGPDDLQFKQQQVYNHNQPYITDPEAAIGLALTRPVSRGTLLTANMLTRPQLISKGDSVTMIWQGHQLRVTMTGVALENGAEGDRVRLRNTRSNRGVEGEVQADGSVKVF